MSSFIPHPVSGSPEEHPSEILGELLGRLNFERLPEAARSLQDFRLQRMEAFLAELGNPQFSVPTVHIAGSKGKGSTATMVAGIASAAGCRVGLFTSPHILRFEERFLIDGRMASSQEIRQLWERLRPAMEKLDNVSPPGPTFFEIMTALGWLHFQQQKVDLAVIEVGLGGRLDSTNVCAPLVTAITSISRDHMRLLGNTVEEIAREKAGIAKPGVPLILSNIAAGPAGVIAEVAAQQKSTLLRLGHDFHAVARLPGAAPYLTPPCYELDYRHGLTELRHLTLAMPGEHQTANAAVAVAICMQLRRHGLAISDSAVREGLLKSRCPLRVEVKGTQPLLIVDVAHNPASIAAVCETLRSVQARSRIAVFGASRDKEVQVLLEHLRKHFDKFILTRFVNNPRAVELDEFQKMAVELGLPHWALAATPAEALAEARRIAQPDDLICVTGSFFLAAEVSELL